MSTVVILSLPTNVKLLLSKKKPKQFHPAVFYDTLLIICSHQPRLLLCLDSWRWSDRWAANLSLTRRRGEGELFFPRMNLGGKIKYYLLPSPPQKRRGPWSVTSAVLSPVLLLYGEWWSVALLLWVSRSGWGWYLSYYLVPAFKTLGLARKER